MRACGESVGYSPPVIWLIAILTLSVLIIIHEYGHYIGARIGGMHVDRFSVFGIGPVLVRLGVWKGTEYVISAIPFGAYVHIVGMEPDDEEDEEMEARPAPKGYRLFRDSPIWARALAIAGGPIANYLTAMAICISIFGFVGISAPTKTGIAGFGPNSPAEQGCLEEGDIYVSIAGESVQGDNPRMRVIEVSSAHLGETVPVVVERDGKELSFQVKLNDQAPALGAAFVDEERYTKVSPTEAISAGIMRPLEQTGAQLKALGAMISGESKGEVGGPSAIVKAIKSSLDNGLVSFLSMAALISAMLGLFNFLPLPALDGGRLAFMLYEVIARRPANKNIEAWVHGIGILFLLSFLAFVEGRAVYRAVTADDTEDTKAADGQGKGEPGWRQQCETLASTRDDAGEEKIAAAQGA